MSPPPINCSMPAIIITTNTIFLTIRSIANLPELRTGYPLANRDPTGIARPYRVTSAPQPRLASRRIRAPQLACFLHGHAQQTGQLNRLNGRNDRALKLLDANLHAGDGRAA